MRRPRVKLDNLITFMTVAARHNIDEAADELGLSASGVRRQLENIEEALGIRMFESGRGRLVLTEDGESFRDDARKAVDQVLLAEEQLAARRAIRNHHLVIGHSTNLPPKVIAAINQLHIEDESPVHIEHRTGLTTTTVRGVIEGSLHAGFGLLPIRASELVVRTIFEEPLVVCMPTGHRLAVKPAISPSDLDEEPMIAVSREPWPERHHEIEEHLSDFGVVPRIVVDAYSAPEAITYVEQKIGICLLAGTSIGGRTGVIAKPLSTNVLRRRSGVFIREDNHSPFLQKLLEISLLRSNSLYLKQGPSSATTREHFQRVKRIS